MRLAALWGLWKRLWGYGFVWDGLFMEVNYKQYLYKCGLQEKQRENFTFGNDIFLEKERRKLEMEAVD